MDAVLEKIKSRGYWRVLVRPTRFVEHRLPYPALEPAIRHSVVALRGWDFPHISPHQDIERTQDWIGQASQFAHHIDAWRFYESGQFLAYRAMILDWYEASELVGNWSKLKPGQFLGNIETLYQLTEYYEFAARLSVAADLDEVLVRLELEKLKDRVLFSSDPGSWLSAHSFRTDAARFTHQTTSSRAELTSEARTLALKAAKELFARFNWNPSIETLRSYQDKLPG